MCAAFCVEWKRQAASASAQKPKAGHLRRTGLIDKRMRGAWGKIPYTAICVGRRETIRKRISTIARDEALKEDMTHRPKYARRTGRKFPCVMFCVGRRSFRKHAHFAVNLNLEQSV